MRLYLAHILCNVGVYRGGCTLYVEHGTAAIDKGLDPILREHNVVVITHALFNTIQHRLTGPGNLNLAARYITMCLVISIILQKLCPR